MTTPPNILVFAGSARRDSLNKRLARWVAALAEEAGAAATFLDLADHPMPLFNQDLEASDGMPAEARAFREQLSSHDGFVIASPEYNSSVTPLLKNAIDWASRSPEGGGDLSSYQGKVAGLVAASPGALGGLRGLVHLRAILGNIGVHVVPSQMAISHAANALEEDGRPTEEAQASRVRAVAQEVVRVTSALRG